jgi:hypothetical protein
MDELAEWWENNDLPWLEALARRTRVHVYVVATAAV